MENTFLGIVAHDIVERYGIDLTRIAVVFPNKRAALFFNQELYSAAGKPVWAPTYYTISELFHNNSPYNIVDPILAIAELHKIYNGITGKDETLDSFFEWGKVLISDFDDIDKNLVEPQELFANIANIHEFDNIDYLTENQKKTLKRFFANFSDEHNTQIKTAFLTLWNKLGDIYNSYRKQLYDKGLAYEGMLYRDAIENKRINAEKDIYIFIGFNLLHKVELRLFQQLKEQGKAEFYWDFDTFYCKPNSKTQSYEAGKYIAQYIKTLGNQMPNKLYSKAYHNFDNKKSVEFVKTKTENIQARYVAQWLITDNRYACGSHTAIIMCDETLLLPILYSLPDSCDKEYDVNITAGYPLAQTPIASFVMLLLELQSVGKRSDGTFRYKTVKSLLLHPYSTLAANSSSELLKDLDNRHVYFPTRKDLAIDSNLDLLFSTPATNSELLKWLLDIIKVLAPNCTSEFYQESVFSIYTIINRLLSLVDENQLEIDHTTLQKLIRQLIATSSIPFHGEPAKGFQIMGLLESRNLDFDHLLILSCNEGNMPKGIRDSSFIPYALRKTYGLTTVDNKVAIYAYYFFRLIQRAKDITIMYNSATENGNRGEMSRFMLQMLVETGFDIKRTALETGQNAMLLQDKPVNKTVEMMQKLHMMSSSEHPLSPSAINLYMTCPMKFYYNYMAKIKQPDEELDEDISMRAFGNIFHNTMEQLYRPYAGIGRSVTASQIDKISQKQNVEDIVDRMFQKEIYGIDRPLRKKVRYNGMQLLSKTVLVKYLERMLELDKQQAPFNIISVEANVQKTVIIRTSEGNVNVSIGGRVDRIDELTDQETGKRIIRIVDYKTGSSNITNTPKDIESIFHANESERKKGHTDYYFQTMLYSEIIRNDEKTQHLFNPNTLPVAPALVFIQKATTKDYDPILCIGKERITDVAIFSQGFNDNLYALLCEIFDPHTPFKRTQDCDACKYCPYTGFCGRN